MPRICRRRGNRRRKLPTACSGRNTWGPTGLILDYAGEIPSPKDIEDGVPNFLSWWSPIENGAKFTGLYIAAACRRAEDTGNESDIAKARKLAKGLMLCASVSDVKGFVARGVGTDGKSHYPFGSEDQTVPWLYGMYSYYKSRIPSEAERAEIRKKPKYAKPSTQLMELPVRREVRRGFAREHIGLPLPPNPVLSVLFARGIPRDRR